MEFEWNIFPQFNMLQLSEEVKRLLLKVDETPENFTGRITFMSYSMTFLVERKTMKKNVWQMPNSYICAREDLEKDNGHSLVLVLKRSGIVSVRSPHGIWDNMAERMLLESADSGCPVFRSTTPLSRGQPKSKGHGKLWIHYAAYLETIETFSHNCFCKPAQSLRSSRRDMSNVSLHDRSGRPVVMGQSSSSLVLSVIKTEVPLDL